MTDYGKGAVLGAATVLPATAASGIFLADKLNPWIVAGFMGINLLWLIIVAAHISRYLFNRNTK